MKLVQLVLLVTCVSAGILDGLEATIERSTTEESFDEKLRTGYNLLENEPHAVDTRKLLDELHDMEEEIKEELALSPEQNANLSNTMKNYVVVEKNHFQPLGDSIEEINRHSKVDMALFQGDMLLTKEQAEEIVDDINENKNHRNKRQAFRDHTYPTNIWSNGVHYSFYSNASNAVRSVFRKAAEAWQSETCIDFSESNTTRDRIVVIMEDGCWSMVGKTGGVQHLSLGNRCESVGTAAHEIGHALGFFHTQSRHDRDDFITLYTENFVVNLSHVVMQVIISNGACGFRTAGFTKRSEHTNYNYNLTYDYGSVMHYGATSVSKNDEPIMVPRDINYMQTLGSPFISFYEKLMMNMHYKCLDKCFTNSSAKCENGGFPHPRDCSKCICPSGYGGRLCKRRPKGCGETLKATTSFQTLEDIISRRSPRDGDFTMCNYWIKAPAGSTIEVVLESFTRGLAVDGCIYAGVEIKTGMDKRHTGYRFCAPEYAETSLNSTHNVVPIITYGGAVETKTVLRYRIVPSVPQPEDPLDCKGSSICISLVKRGFCHFLKYVKGLRKLICPKSCGFC